MLCVESLPYGIGRLSNSVPFYQFPCHRREHVVVFIDVLQTLASKLSFHGQGHEKLFAHQPQTRRLHGSFIAKKLHPDRPSLTDAPGSAARLPQRVQGVSRLIENDGRKIQEIEPGFDQLGMGNYDLYAFLDLSRIPRFPLRVSTLARRTAVRIPSLLRIR